MHSYVVKGMNANQRDINRRLLSVDTLAEMAQIEFAWQVN